MIWLTWRQFRVQFLIALGVLVVFTAYLLYLGDAIRHSYNTAILDCVASNGCQLSTAEGNFVMNYQGPVTVAGVLLMAVPAIVGLFWGTPMITRELESNTHRLVWNQSVTRTRWLGVKLTLIGLFTVAVTGVLSLLLTWAASRFDLVQGNRFMPIAFASRNIAPVGYAIFAFVLGIVVGLVVRRTVPAMAVTLALVAVIQFLIPIAARPHLRTPVTKSVPFTTSTISHGLSIQRNGPITIEGYSIPGALMLTSSVDLLDSAGNTVDSSDVSSCIQGDPITTTACLARQNLHIEVTYQPADRYWSFQWLEFGGFLVLTVLLSGVAFRQVRRVRG